MWKNQSIKDLIIHLINAYLQPSPLRPTPAKKVSKGSYKILAFLKLSDFFFVL